MIAAVVMGATLGAGHFGAALMGVFWLTIAQPLGALGVRATMRMWPLPPCAAVLATVDTAATMDIHPLVAGLVLVVLGGLVGIATTQPRGAVHRTLWPANPDLMGDFQRNAARLMREAHLAPFDLLVDVERKAHRIDVEPADDLDVAPTQVQAVCAQAAYWLEHALQQWSFSEQDPFLGQRLSAAGSVARFSVRVPHIPENAHATLHRMAHTTHT